MSSPLNPTGNNTAAPQDVSQTMNDQEKKLQRMYGKLPTGRDLLGHKLKERKYFDSGDYALSKAGKTSTPVGSQHPQPENIPHSNPAAPNAGSPPVKESSLVHESEIPESANPASQS
ncbi:hypothetical protein BGZ80_011548 [Entomortierella chlamydospora]|uniref:mRNA stability protein n=1 Tax=Entomortierella chlamydospora TaxID=101097 RepID=A0A9P6SYZ2_9FUNG|nr:hypothetical protein BGZ79_006370 [Entomortierella chlamydospora]KAG0012737.1 hypothetical protein BGZ80_011548 [Entomortierella chlamydospora]